MKFQSMRKIGKNFCPNFPHPLLENLTEETVTAKGGILFQYFTNLTEKADPLLRWWLVRINIQETREYLKCGNQVDP